MNPIKFALIGAGMIGELHAKVISNMKGADLVAVCSHDLDRAKRLTDLYGGEPTTDFDSLIAREDVDAITICTASGEHALYGIPAAQAGKHVMVEKPIDISLEKADALIQTCTANNVKLGVIFQLRFLDISQEVKQALTDGTLGKLVMADCYMKFYRPQDYYDNSRWKGTIALDGGGALINQGVHGLDLLLYLAGDIASVKAYTGMLAHQDIEVEDTCVAAVKYTNGALGVIQATTSIHPDFQQRIELHGTEGTIIIEGTEDLWIEHWETFKDGKRKTESKTIEVSGAHAVLEEGGEGHERQFEDFITAIRKNLEPLVNGPEGRRSLSAVRAIYDSAKSNQEVQIT
ncbi:MAG: Gfo/Idh/MocA family oxidoreductase [Candidatus Latescibacteria bacterium]|jgi:UDP-N-acetyl-2-amino-2-deoxyglucuronate dehydrogenase|nr:Gfo/Idh/MocA family oxidoreductase [Candidatus Latescibacterota bacterium]MBT5831706.1 Gfo/Idh/MocA family oxidoreductase [Candidatus Latescibacterota bacterium]